MTPRLDLLHQSLTHRVNDVPGSNEEGEGLDVDGGGEEEEGAEDDGRVHHRSQQTPQLSPHAAAYLTTRAACTYAARIVCVLIFISGSIEELKCRHVHSQ